MPLNTSADNWPKTLYALTDTKDSLSRSITNEVVGLNGLGNASLIAYPPGIDTSYKTSI